MPELRTLLLARSKVVGWLITFAVVIFLFVLVIGIFVSCDRHPRQSTRKPAAYANDQGPTSPAQLNQGMGVIWWGSRVAAYSTDNKPMHSRTAELGLRSDGVVVWRYRQDWEGLE